MSAASLAPFLRGGAGRIRAALDAVADEARPALAAALGRHLGDGKAPLAERLAAGTALALLGDPRLDPRRPAMVRIPAGPFRMGMREEEVAGVAREFDIPRAWLEKACPQHEVELDAFEIGRFPVTQGEWAAFLEATGHPEAPPVFAGRRPRPGRQNHPVHGVSFEAMQAYCAWLSRETGLRWRLPTEAEWEKAARGTDGRAWPWGPRFDPACANTREAGVGDTSPVGAFPDGASPWGLVDVAGNVEEATGSFDHLYEGSPLDDPDAGAARVTRGGCFALDGDLARCDRRHRASYGGVVGFRLARSRAASETAGDDGEAAS